VTASEVMSLYQQIVRDNTRINKKVVDLIMVIVLSAGDEATLNGLGAAFEEVLPQNVKECVA